MNESTMPTRLPVTCPSTAHDQHYEGCPRGKCQGIRAARPVATAMQAKHLSGASIGKLVEWSDSRSITTNEHLWSPISTLGAVTHGGTSTTLWIEWDHDHGDEVELNPTDWVRVTQVAA